MTSTSQTYCSFLIDNLVATNKRALVPVKDEEFILEQISDDDENDDPNDDDFKIGDEFDVEPVRTTTTEPSDENKKTVWRALSVWNRYRTHLTNAISWVAYLCSPNPIIVVHSQYTDNTDSEKILAVERVIEKMIPSIYHKKAQDRMMNWQGPWTSSGRNTKNLFS